MILTSVIVVAIVGDALAFNKKKSDAFCVSLDANDSCDTILYNKRIVPFGATIYLYYAGWDGDPLLCGSTNCTTLVRLNIN
jgi:hypothetical protein